MNPEVEPIDFYESQTDAGKPIFIYTIDSNAHVSCYFWFDSYCQLLASIIEHGDFWHWNADWSDAKRALTDIIEKYPENIDVNDDLMSELQDYMLENANIHLYAWGTFEELCTGDDEFSKEVREEFREAYSENYEDEEDETEPTSEITETELDDFLQYLVDIPS
jgi:hypothetical protein